MHAEEEAQGQEIEALAAIELLTRRKMRKGLCPEYVEKVFQTVDPGTEFKPNWHIDLICEYLEACYRGEITRLIINVPPRTLKSILVSVAWPASILGRDPTSKILTTSYSKDLAKQHSVACRNVIRSDWHRQLFPALQIARDEDEKMEYRMKKNDLTPGRGFRIGTSIGGTITGKGGNILIVDDPHKPTASDAERKSAIEWYKNTFYTRLDDKKKGVIVVIMQRLHDEDLTGHLIEQEGDFVHLCIPAVAEESKTYHFGNVKKVREEGEFLHEEREGKEEIEKAKKAMGDAYYGQYQQRPSPAEGNLIKRHDLEYYDEAPMVFYKRQTWNDLIISWDMAFKDTETSAFVVGQVWGRIMANRYLLDESRAKMDFGATLAAVLALEAKWPRCTAIFVEDKANGPAIINTLKRKLPRIVAVNPEGGKIARVQAVLPQFQAHNVFIPSRVSWIKDFVDELANFPKGKYADRVDAMSQGLNELTKRETQLAKVARQRRKAEEVLNDYNVKSEDLLGGRRTLGKK